MPSMHRPEVWFELWNHLGEDVFLYVPKVVNDTFGATNNVGPTILVGSNATRKLNSGSNSLRLSQGMMALAICC